jgi:hypothetical protein
VPALAASAEQQPQLSTDSQASDSPVLAPHFISNYSIFAVTLVHALWISQGQLHSPLCDNRRNNYTPIVVESFSSVHSTDWPELQEIMNLMNGLITLIYGTGYVALPLRNI